ncbi:MAG: hypothetical protein QM703_29825 [Gemmatales bacterium]
MLTVLTTFFGYLARIPAAIVRGWDRFFFTPSDPIMLGIIRIAVGSILLYIHLSSAVAVLDFIGPGAWVDAETYAELYELPAHPKYQLKEKSHSRVIWTFMLCGSACSRPMLSPSGSM